MQCNHRFKLLSPWIPHFAGLYPWTVSQIQPFILCISLVRIFYHSNQKSTQYRTRLMNALWFGADTAVSLWFPEQKRPSDLIFCCHRYRILNVRLFQTPSSLFSVEDYGFKFGSKLRSLPFPAGRKHLQVLSLRGCSILRWQPRVL